MSDRYPVREPFEISYFPAQCKFPKNVDRKSDSTVRSVFLVKMFPCQ
jgi:hypothetical protein